MYHIRVSRFTVMFFLLMWTLLPAAAQEKKKNPAKPAAPETAKKDEEKKDPPVYDFTIEKELPRTPVKNQARTGTCWSFATVSFLESELLRLGKGEVDLSEIFAARMIYPQKAANYIRRHGNATFGQGGQSHDVIETLKQYGMITEEAYSGLNIGEPRHNHSEMNAILQGMLDGILKGRKLTPRWPEAFAAVLDIYLGQVPREFTYQGKSYTPLSFQQEVLQLPLDQYIEITSYTHHPFYQQIALEIPDNWNYSSCYYNVPFDDYEAILDHALKNGYSVAWDGDVSEKEFSQNESGVAVVPLKDFDDKTKAEKDAKLKEPEPEKEPGQELRQQTFDNHTTTDDHLMHIVGLAKDQKGTKYYLVKNSHGTDRKYDGYYYMSRCYTLVKSTSYMIHRDAVPAEIAARMGLR